MRSAITRRYTVSNWGSKGKTGADTNGIKLGSNSLLFQCVACNATRCHKECIGPALSTCASILLNCGRIAEKTLLAWRYPGCC